MEQLFTGKTVEEAVQNGLSHWQVREHQVKIEVIDPGKKGLFGFGQRDAQVNMTIIDPELKRTPPVPKVEEIPIETKQHQAETVQPESQAEQLNEAKARLPQSAEQTADYIKSIVKEMGIDVCATTLFKGNEITIELYSEDAALIIGKRGQTLNALQVLAQTHMQQIQKSFVVVTLDIENYREKRRETLQNLALNMAKKARATKQSVKFEPMPNYERKIMHQVLSNMPDIETYSEGREPHRYLVIKVKS